MEKLRINEQFAMASAFEICNVFYSSTSLLSGGGTRRFVCLAAPQVPPLRATSGVATRNFGRLKVHRVKNLVKESFRRNENENGLENQELKTETSRYPSAVESDDEPGVLDELQTSKVQKHIRETLKFVRESAKEDVSSKFSSASSKQWGNVKQVYPQKYVGEKVPKKERKLSAISDFFCSKSFKEVGCNDRIVESMNNLQYIRPSHIQAMAFAPILNGKSCIVADQSGSGKTLAYLLPIVQRLRQEELEGKPESQNPRILLLVPTAELASQVLSICRSLSKAGVPFRSMVATGGFRQKTQVENLGKGVDILIATPGRFMFLVKGGFIQLTNLRSAILDEVDILYNDEDFEQALESLIQSAPIATQYLFVTATLPLDIYNKLVEVFPDCGLIMGPGIHCTSPGLEEILIDCSGQVEAEKTLDTAFLNKKNALLRLAEGTPVKKTIVFCNKIETCRKVENALKRFDRKETSVKVLPFHSALDQESRTANLELFRSFPSNNVSMFLICTDRASRGMDFAGVDHVVLFDFPRDPSEYVRRVGRTARGARGKGKAYIFVVGKQVSLARRIIERNRTGHPLHDLPST